MPKIKVPGLVSGKMSLLGLQMAANLLHPYMAFPLCACTESKRAQVALLPLGTRYLNWGPTLMT